MCIVVNSYQHNYLLTLINIQFLFLAQHLTSPVDQSERALSTCVFKTYKKNLLPTVEMVLINSTFERFHKNPMKKSMTVHLFGKVTDLQAPSLSPSLKFFQSFLGNQCEKRLLYLPRIVTQQMSLMLVTLSHAKIRGIFLLPVCFLCENNGFVQKVTVIGFYVKLNVDLSE